MSLSRLMVCDDVITKLYKIVNNYTGSKYYCIDYNLILIIRLKTSSICMQFQQILITIIHINI